jgi:ElaB/YqjD/DUF883 family membrane-anchored ribosome-binding protein
MNTNGHQSSREIERDVEQTRARMTETLDELRARMSPGQILDEVLDYAKGSGGRRMMHNVGRTLQDNPAPLLVIGAGIAWMMAAARPSAGSDASYLRGDWMARRNERRGDGPNWDFRTSASEAVSSAADSARRTGEQISDSVSAAADAASETYPGVRNAAAQGMHEMRDTANRAGSAAYRSTRDFAGSATNMLRDQPFVFGALGVALGAALGAALPETELEDDLMGEASDAVKDKVSEAGAAGYEKAKAVAEKTWDSASREAEAQGLTTERAEEALDNIGDKADSVREAATDSAREEASRQGLMSDDSGQRKSQDGRSGSSFEGSRSPVD